MRRVRGLPIFLVVAALLLAVAFLRCARDLSGPTRLVRAIEQARASLPSFRRRLRDRAPADREFFVRASFGRKGETPEILWMKEVELSVGGFTGIVAESPFALNWLHRGDPQPVLDADVVDWAISHADGSREGNFTAGLEPGH